MKSPYFIILGHGRSGTSYMAALMRHLGYGVTHQNLGPDGTSQFQVAWHLFAGKWRRPTIGRNGRGDGCILIHAVRNPWKVIESCHGVKGSPTKTILGLDPSLTGVNKLDSIVRTVVNWNERIDKLRPDLTVRVEDAETVVPAWLGARDLHRDRVGNPPPHDVNHINHGTLSLEDYDIVPKESMDELKLHCAEYGYPEHP